MSLFPHNDGKHPVVETEEHFSPSQKAADLMTTFFGSWSFIMWFLIFVMIWAGLNGVAWIYHWDPYPFILLNLMLSMISALQAPVILMSQNRQTELDRVAAEYDFEVNRKAEYEIRQLRADVAELKTLLTAKVVKRKVAPKKRTRKVATKKTAKKTGPKKRVATKRTSKKKVAVKKRTTKARSKKK